MNNPVQVACVSYVGIRIIQYFFSLQASWCLRETDCKNMFRGKMTKPEIWTKMLEFREISVLSTGCGMETTPDIAVEQTSVKIPERLSFKHSECITGKGMQGHNSFFNLKEGPS